MSKWRVTGASSSGATTTCTQWWIIRICLLHNKETKMLRRGEIMLAILICCTLFLAACDKTKQPQTLFQRLPPSHTHINFSNDLQYDERFNIYTYTNFY